MSDEVIRYGAGGKPYRGQVGPHSTDAEPTPAEPAPEEPKVEMSFEEDDTPVTDDEVKVKGKGK